MKKLNLYAIALCSSLLLATGAQAINTGEGGRGGLSLDGRSGSPSGGAMRGMPTQQIQNFALECEGCGEEGWQGEWDGPHDGSGSGSFDVDFESEQEFGTRAVESDPRMRHSTGDEERGSNAAIVGARATGSPEVSLGHHSDSFEVDGSVGPISHGRDH